MPQQVHALDTYPQIAHGASPSPPPSHSSPDTLTSRASACHLVQVCLPLQNHKAIIPPQKIRNDSLILNYPKTRSPTTCVTHSTIICRINVLSLQYHLPNKHLRHTTSNTVNSGLTGLRCSISPTPTSLAGTYVLSTCLLFRFPQEIS